MKNADFPRSKRGDGQVVVFDNTANKEGSITNLVVVPGYGEGVDQFKNFGEELSKAYDTPLRIVLFDFPRIQKVSNERLEALYPNDSEKKFYFSKPLLRKMHRFIELFETMDRKDVTVIAHSAGSIIATYAAHFRPDLFQDVKFIFVNPAGLIKKADFSLQTGRFFKNWWYELRTHHIGFIEIAFDALVYMLSKPKHSYAEAKAIADSDLTDLLIDMLNTEVFHCTMIFDKNDKLFTADELTASYLKIRLSLNEQAHSRFFAELTDSGFQHYGITTKYKEFIKIISETLSQR